MISAATVPGDVEYTYEATPGSRVKNEDAPVVGAWLEELGAADAQEIVDEAGRPGAPRPVHNYFEWDDRRAGTLYRLNQASRLARAVRVKVISRDSEGNESGSLSGPAFYAVREPVDDVAQERGEASRRKVYVSFRTVERDDEYQAQVIEDARRELIGRRRKYAASIEMFAQAAPGLSDVFDAIAKLEEEENEAERNEEEEE